MADKLTLHGDEAALFARLAERLERVVAGKVNVPRVVIEDACQSAWLILLRRQPDRETLFGWLVVVAKHEAYRLAAEQGHHAGLANQLLESQPSLVVDDDPLWFAERLHDLNRLRERERRMLLLHAAGFKYAEIARLTGDSVRTVERQLRRAREKRDCG
jgi:RNA polymerase sigma factor (sigma-70 family)